MAHKSKHDKFHFSFAVFIRLVIFSLVIAFSIIYFSSKKTKNFVLGDSIEIKPYVDTIYQQIPPQSRKSLETLSTNPAILSLETRMKSLQLETNGFPQKQINEIKKMIINQIYQNAIKSIDQPTK